MNGVPEILRSNNIGAETTILEIIFRYPEGPGATLHRMENAELRVRYLLDIHWRNRRRQPGQLTNVPEVDYSIDKDNILCLWDQYMAPPTATETWVKYVVAYNRNVPK